MERGRDFWERFLLAERSPMMRYGVGFALALASLAGARVLHTAGVPGAGSLALATVVLSGIYGGFGPALLDALVTAVGLEYLTDPVFVLFDSWDSVLRLALHGAVGFLIADIVASLRAAYRNVRNEHAQAELAKQARENVLSIVSHDLRSPLTVIKMSLEMLQRRAEPGEKAEAHVAALGAAERAADQMQRIIEDLLDALRIEKGQFRVNTARHELPTIVDDALTAVRPLADARGIRFTLHCEPLSVECDRVRLLQVLNNLLHNAVKFSADGGSIEVTAALDAGAVCISVKDYGRGINEELMAGLFRRHWQAADSAHRGTGLGLFISKSIVEAHGGRIEVESAPGAGARFTVYLPSGAAG